MRVSHLSFQPIVVIADDDPDIVTLLHTVVERLGAYPLGVTNGVDALVTVTSHLGSIAAVILDHQMPGLNGSAVAAAIRRLTPTLPIIMISGYLSKEERAFLDALTLTIILQKPFTLQDLRAVLTPFVAQHTSDVAIPPAE
jgi:CheY-like chemotaxis protein